MSLQLLSFVFVNGVSTTILIKYLTDYIYTKVSKEKDEQVLWLLAKINKLESEVSDLHETIDTLEEKLIAISGLKENSVVLQKRHEEILKETLSNLENSFNKAQDIVLLSYYIRLSLSSLGRIFGNFEIEEILGKIFSNFCVGK